MKQQHVIGNVSIDYRELRDRLVREHGAVFHDATLARTNVTTRVEQNDSTIQRRDDLARQVNRKSDAVQELMTARNALLNSWKPRVCNLTKADKK
jgi:hypothetical protein